MSTEVEPRLRRPTRPSSFADRVYAQLKDDIFEFRLLPGERFTEGEIAERMALSRTPVRQALYRLQRDGFLDVYFRSGWQVRQLDFDYFDQLYDVRVVLELAAVQRLCEDCARTRSPELDELARVWNGAAAAVEGPAVAALDEKFHGALVEATGNAEMARIHRALSEKIRIIRRLDFGQPGRVEATYAEHSAILGAILRGDGRKAARLLKAHIELSKTEVRKITVHMLHAAHRRAQAKAAQSESEGER